MSQVVRPDSVQKDLKEIGHLVAQQRQSLDLALRFLDRIDEKCRLYATHPEMGTRRADLGAEVRCFSVGDYVVFYELSLKFASRDDQWIIRYQKNSNPSSKPLLHRGVFVCARGDFGGVRLLVSNEELRQEIQIGIDQADRGEVHDHGVSNRSIATQTIPRRDWSSAVRTT